MQFCLSPYRLRAAKRIGKPLETGDPSAPDKPVQPESNGLRAAALNNPEDIFLTGCDGR
jgi:hypothetical protein